MQIFTNWQQSPQQGAIIQPTDWERQALADDLTTALTFLQAAHDAAIKANLKETRNGFYTAIADALNSTEEAIQRSEDALDY